MIKYSHNIITVTTIRGVSQLLLLQLVVVYYATKAVKELGNKGSNSFAFLYALVAMYTT